MQQLLLRCGVMECVSKILPGREQRMEAFLAAFCEHQHQREQRQDHQHAQFEVAASIKEMIPGPEMLSEWHGAKRYGREKQQNPAN